MSYADSIYTRLDHPWSSEIVGPNGLPYRSGVSFEEMRNRARRLERESSLAYGILDRAVENIIGTGIDVQPKSDDEEFNKEAGDLWLQWTEGKHADVRRMYSFGQLQRLAKRAELRDGDCGFVLLDRMDQGFNWPELQFVEGDLIKAKTGGYNPNLYEGIEYSTVNAPVAFHVNGTRVEARDFVFLHNSVRYNVGRGEPRFHGTYRLFDQLEGHIEAVVVAARIAACQAMIAKRKNPDTKLRQMARAGTTQNTEGLAVAAKPIEPGMINIIDIDEDLVGFTPQQPHQDFKGFVVTVARMLGLKFGLTVERVLLDFSAVNYSGQRATRLQEQAAANPEQWNFDAAFFSRVYPWFISKMINRGRIKRKPPQNAWAYEWIPPALPILEPSAEAGGLQALIAMGVEAPENIATSMGYRWPKLLATLKKNRDELADVGLTLYGEPAPAVASPNGGEEVTARDKIEAYGVAVRAGSITPQREDEEVTRNLLDLPPMSKEAEGAWDEDGIRRPITIAKEELPAVTDANAPENTKPRTPQGVEFEHFAR